MPCDDPSHNHRWPTSGPLKIERCERYCAYCRDPKRTKTGKEWESARHLRKHVEVHTKPGAEFEDIIILKGKTGRPPREKSNYRTSSASRQYDDYGDEDEDEVLTDSPGRPSTGRDRGAKKRAQEQIKISAALPLVYEPDPSPSPSPEPDLPMADAKDDNSIVFSDEDNPISKRKAPTSRGKKGYESRHDWAISRPRIRGRFPTAAETASLELQHSDAGPRVVISQRVNARPQAVTAAAEQSHRPATSSPTGFYARRPDISKVSRPSSSSSRGRGGRTPRAGIPRSRTPDDESEDVESQSPPRPSAEALNRIRQHKERREREMRGPRHPNAGKRYVPPTKDYSQLWLKEFEPGE